MLCQQVESSSLCLNGEWSLLHIQEGAPTGSVLLIVEKLVYAVTFCEWPSEFP